MATGCQRNGILTPVTGHIDSSPIPVRAEQVSAILVDGGFYRRRAARLFGHKQPEQRADELVEYCRRHTRKVALRRGEILETQSGYQLRNDKLKKLLEGAITIDDLSESDFTLDIIQKGVDMRLGLDIATLAAHGQVNQIIMIAGDSDFVPAAKHARRAGIDFVLDPMWAQISESLHEHIDGLWECVRREPRNLDDPLHVNNLDGVVSAPSSDDEDLEL